jgi:hypothetical protein
MSDHFSDRVTDRTNVALYLRSSGKAMIMKDGCRFRELLGRAWHTCPYISSHFFVSLTSSVVDNKACTLCIPR